MIFISLLTIFSTFICTENDVDKHWRLIKNIIISCIDAHAPLKRVNLKNSNNLPWIDKAYIKLSQYRDALFYKALDFEKNFECRSELIWKDYKDTRNACSTLFFKSKSSYFKNFIDSTSVSTKKLWKKLSPFLTPNKKTALIAPKILNNTSLNTDFHLSSSFCNYFSSITNSFNFIPLPDCLKFVNNFLSIIPVFNCLNSTSGFMLPDFTIDEVVKGLKTLAPNSGCGESGIEATVLVNSAEALGKPFTDLFNLILKTGTYPDEWKYAHITPIFKSGKVTDLSNYRPISILSPISKLFESIVSTKIMSYLESEKLLHNAQFAYRKKTSTEHAIITMIEEWRSKLDSGKDVIAIFLDLSKAFDTVNHEILLTKLKYYNFHSHFIKLISNYLSNRKIKVKVNDQLSESQSIDVGVPQGSVLGPLLFIIYFNDFNFLDTLSNNFLYADDTTMSSHGSDINLIIKNLERDLVKVEEWLNHNRLLINWKKTQAIHFSSTFKDRDIALNNNPNIEISQHKYISFKDKNITFVKNFKLLGFIVDNKLKFEDQVRAVCKKVNSITGLLAKSSYLFSDKIKPTLFKLFIMNRFEYCGAAIMHLPNRTCLERLEKCFAKSLLRLLKVNIFTFSDADAFIFLKKKFNILPLKYRLFFHFYTFLFNLCINNNIFFINNFNKNTRSTRSLPFKEIPFKTDHGKYSFTTIATRVLNKCLAKHLLEFDSIAKFKTYLKSNYNLINDYDKSKGIWTKT